MKKKFFTAINFFLIGALVGANFVVPVFVFGARAQSSVYVTATVVATVLPACNDTADNDGDGKTDYPDDPGCSSTADNDETDPAPAPSSGGGGGGGGGAVNVPVTRVTFLGRAYSKSVVTLLKDAQIAATTTAGTDANFQITITGISAGNYSFSLYSEDRKGNRSGLLTFPINITQGATTQVTGIFIAPTIEIDKSEVKRGDFIVISGQSVPEAEISISVSSNTEITAKTNADKDGKYLYNFGTAILGFGSYGVKAKAVLGPQSVSGYSSLVSFKVGSQNVVKTQRPTKGDLNNDSRVNLVDFSIVAFWYGRPLSDSFKKIEKEILNGDGKVDLVDLSILAYYWTG